MASHDRWEAVGAHETFNIIRPIRKRKTEIEALADDLTTIVLVARHEDGFLGSGIICGQRVGDDVPIEVGGEFVRQCQPKDQGWMQRSCRQS